MLHEKIISGLYAAAVTQTVHTEMNGKLNCFIPSAFHPSFSGPHAGLSQQGQWPKNADSYLVCIKCVLHIPLQILLHIFFTVIKI
jgi:hypothetical protein